MRHLQNSFIYIITIYCACNFVHFQPGHLVPVEIAKAAHQDISVLLQKGGIFRADFRHRPVLRLFLPQQPAHTCQNAAGFAFRPLFRQPHIAVFHPEISYHQNQFAVIILVLLVADGLFYIFRVFLRHLYQIGYRLAADLVFVHPDFRGIDGSLFLRFFQGYHVLVKGIIASYGQYFVTG